MNHHAAAAFLITAALLILLAQPVDQWVRRWWR